MAPSNLQHLDGSILLFDAFLKTHLNAHEDALTLSLTNRGTQVRRILIDPRSSTDLIFLTILKARKLVCSHIDQPKRILIGFNGVQTYSLRDLELPVIEGLVTLKVIFMVVDESSSFQYYTR